MLKKGLSLLFLLFLTVYLAAQPKVAVLDATLGEGVSHNASAIVADTINEQFVKAVNFTAIDRAYISNIQEEKKFQLSGDVNEADIKEIGNTFGADYLCVANVSLLGETYTVSARLIEVSTAEVRSQESHRMKGEIDILFMIAEIVGAELVGADMANLEIASSDDITQEPMPLVEPEPEPEPETRRTTQPEPVRTEQTSKPKAKGHLMFSLIFPGYAGATDFTDDNGYILYELDYDYGYWYGFEDYDKSMMNLGVDIHFLNPFFNILYFSLGFTYANQSLFYDSDYYSYEFDKFSTYEPYLGLGVVLAPFSHLEFYGGLTLGVMILALGESYGGDADDSYWGIYAGESANGMSIGFELGATFYAGSLGLDLRYKLARAGTLSGDVIFPEDYTGDASFTHKGLMIGLGFMF